MSTQQHVSREDRLVRRYEYDDRWIVAVDLPVSEEVVAVDVVDETAIAVIDLGDEVVETDIDLPGAAQRAEADNGVITVEVAK